MFGIGSGCSPLSAADRMPVARYRRWSAALLLLYIAASYWVDRVTGAWALWLAGLAGGLFFGFMVAVSRMVMHRLDEFQRLLMTRSLLWATFITMGLVSVWGGVEVSAAYHGWRFPVFWVPGLLVVLTAAMKLLIFRQHRSPAGESDE